MIALSTRAFLLRVSEAQLFVVPLPSVPRGDVGVVFSRDPVQTSAGISVPSDGLLRFSVRFRSVGTAEHCTCRAVGIARGST